MGEHDKAIIGLATKEAKIHSAALQLVLTCRCDSPIPILVFLIPGVPLHAFCPACQMKFKVARFIFDIEKGEQIQVAVSEFMPTIITPQVQ